HALPEQAGAHQDADHGLVLQAGRSRIPLLRKGAYTRGPVGASFRQSWRITRQGLPAATTRGGRLRITTLPAPIVVSSPTVTPGPITTCPPIQTLLPIVTGAASSRPVRRSVGSVGWKAA